MFSREGATEFGGVDHVVRELHLSLQHKIAPGRIQQLLGRNGPQQVELNALVVTD